MWQDGGLTHSSTVVWNEVRHLVGWQVTQEWVMEQVKTLLEILRTPGEGNLMRNVHPLGEHWDYCYFIAKM